MKILDTSLSQFQTGMKSNLEINLTVLILFLGRVKFIKPKEKLKIRSK